MRVAKSLLRKGFCLLCALSAGTGMTVGLGTPASAADVDIYVMDAGVSPTGIGVLPGTASYALQHGTCLDQPLPPPIGGQVPTYFDLPSGGTGVCSAVTGGGDLSVNAGCTTGTITADWTFTEPGNDNALLVGDGVIVDGVAVIAAVPNSLVSGLGYWDPSSATTPGSAAMLAVFTSEPTAVCGTSSGVMDNVDAVVVASY
jgi:hypothetical protein